MALAWIGQSAATAAIGNLVDAAISHVGASRAGPSATQDEIQRLRQASQQIQSILVHVEKGQTLITEQNTALDDWLWQLRDAVEQAEDVLDEMAYYELEKAVQAGDNKVQQGNVRSIKRKFDDFASNSERNSREKKLGEKLREAMEALDHVAASSQNILELVSQLYNSNAKREIEIRNARKTTSLLSDDKIYPEDKIFGRDTERERIVEWLTKPTTDEPENSSATVGKVSAFAIVGMGGMGKTTLAKLIYNDEKVQQCFDLVMWVCVSDQFDVFKLTRKILEAAEVSDGHEELDTIQKILKEKLISKKFLLVLDDVWTDKILEWENLVLPLKFGRKGSKILLTTREDSVADTVRKVLRGQKEEPLKLSGLKKDDFMLLFNKHAFAGENIDNYRDLKLIGEQIAKKLGGCPLAAKVLGGYLNSSMDEKHWRRILNENFLNLQASEDNIRMILRLSYHHLPASLQICFRYCSIFSKDYEFEKNELIHMWIGSGLIKKPTNEKRSLEDIGEEYLNHLTRKSLFDIKKNCLLWNAFSMNAPFAAQDYCVSQDCYVMHDLLHDLAQFVSSGECLGIEGDGSGEIPKTIRHIYVDSVNPLKISHLKNLRTLIIRLNKDSDVVEFNEVLKKLKSLRLLQVTGDNCKLSDEVGNLIHLRYLSLSLRTVEEKEGCFLPQSLCRLHHLEVMKLCGIKIDDSTLDGMSNLVKLRLLDIPRDKMNKIPWIGKVTSLEELEYFGVREECGYNIGQLKYLQKLRKLEIRNLENVKSSKEAADANLIEKNNLHKLTLDWGNNLTLDWGSRRFYGIEVDEPLLDNLRPHTNLKELTIRGYPGVRSPYWMTVASLSDITAIKLQDCWRWETLPPFGQFLWLKFLHLECMWAVKKLWCSRSVGGCAFPSLLELELSGMPDLELFEGEHMFPLLNKLEIYHCPRLKGLPALPLTLNQLEIFAVGLTSLPMMQQDCSSSEGRASCSSSHPALSKLKIWNCPKLTSLDGFMSQQQYFPALVGLSIVKCENLRRLPGKFFQKLPSLKNLWIEMCPNLTTHEIIDDRLPETLENLTLVSNGDLNLSLLESLPKLTSLHSLKIDGCASMTSLPSAVVFPRLWSLTIWDCEELSSLAGLQALPSLAFLNIERCYKLIEPSLLQPPIGLTSTSHTDMLLRPSMEVRIDRQSLLRLEPLRNLNSVSKLTISCDTKLTSLDEQWLLQNRNSLQRLRIYEASSLESLPPSLIDLRSLDSLYIDGALLLQTIPELPTSMKFLNISGCRPELKEYIEGSGKFSNIPRVKVETEEEWLAKDPWRRLITRLR